MSRTMCIDFVLGDCPGESCPLEVEDQCVADFDITNVFPGGDPRTLGFWKNWNCCTSGGQCDNAEANGGPKAGWFILEDLLPQLIGDLTVELCCKGVFVLDKRKVGNNANNCNGGHKKMARDAAYGLAAQLLAAQVNFTVGACSCDEHVQAMADAQDLLECVEFDGTDKYLGPKDSKSKMTDCCPGGVCCSGGASFGCNNRSYATDLARDLDDYNNGLLCAEDCADCSGRIKSNPVALLEKMLDFVANPFVFKRPQAFVCMFSPTCPAECETCASLREKAARFHPERY